MDTFIAELRGSGAPLGPFGQPRTLWRLPSGRGKTHRTKWCRDGLEEVTGTLIEYADSLCDKCAVNGTTGPEFDWELALSPYVAALASKPGRNAATVTLAYAHAVKHDMLFRGIRQVDEWVPAEAVPRLQQMLADMDPVRTPAHTPEAIIRAAASAGTATAMRRGIEGHLKALRDRATDHVGQDGIIGFLVSRADKVYRSRTDLDEARALLEDHAELLLADLDTFKSLDQVNTQTAIPRGNFSTIAELLDSTWRHQASIELTIIVEAFIAAAEELRVEIDAEQEHWYLFENVEEWRAHAGIADTVFTTLLEYRLDDYLVVRARPSIYKWTEDMATSSYVFETDLGPVAADDTLATIKHAVQLRDQFGDDEVLDIARNVLA